MKPLNEETPTASKTLARIDAEGAKGRKKNDHRKNIQIGQVVGKASFGQSTSEVQS